MIFIYFPTKQHLPQNLLPFDKDYFDHLAHKQVVVVDIVLFQLLVPLLPMYMLPFLNLLLVVYELYFLNDVVNYDHQ